MTREEKLEQVLALIEEETNFEVIKEMKAILNKVFGEEYNQIIKPTKESITARIRSTGSGGLYTTIDAHSDDQLPALKKYLLTSYWSYFWYQIIVYFPEVVITNGREKHTIKELYVQAYIKPNGTMHNGIFGLRSLLTEQEARSRYVHSHLHEQFPKEIHFTGFCLGEGPILQVLLLLSRSFSIPNFMMFCLHLKNYVAWESKEGRPYTYLENIGKNTGETAESIYDTTARDAADLLISQIKKSKLSPDVVFDMFTYAVDSGSICARPNRKFEIWAASVIKTWSPARILGTRAPINAFLFHVDNIGRHFPLPAQLNEIDYNPNKVLLNFKGKDISLKIEKSNEEENKFSETVPDKRITAYFGEKFSQQLTTAAFTNARVKTCSAGTDQSETPEPGSVHVQGSVDGGVVGNALL